MNDHAKLAAGSGAKPTASSNQFTVRVADNFHYMDESETYTRGSYGTYAEAVKVCADIVCRSLLEAARPGMSGAELYQQYTTFGEDPFVVGAGPDDAPFSAWEYAKLLCDRIRPPAPAPSKGRIFAPYHELKRMALTCPECGWQGIGAELAVGDVFEGSGIIEYSCPRCSHDIAFTEAPAFGLAPLGADTDAHAVGAPQASRAQRWLRFLRWPW